MKQFFREISLRLAILFGSIRSFILGIKLDQKEFSLAKYLFKLVNSDGKYVPTTYEEQLRHQDLIDKIHEVYGPEVDTKDPEFLLWFASVYGLSLYSIMNHSQKKEIENAAKN